MTKYRGKGKRATDGDKGWTVNNVDHVGETPPGYVPPHDPTAPLPTPEAEKAKATAKARLSPSEVAAGLGCLAVMGFVALCFLWKLGRWAFL